MKYLLYYRKLWIEIHLFSVLYIYISCKYCVKREMNIVLGTASSCSNKEAKIPVVTYHLHTKMKLLPHNCCEIRKCNICLDGGV